MSKAVCRSQYCDPFIIHIVVHNAVHKSKLWPFIINNCLKKSKIRLKTAQNYIMNDIMNDSFAEKKKEPKAFNPLMARQ